ncbi:MAG TPA: hypothetical protein VH186_36385 [Chloroflexia bacterium]|nr:hypothetical protein [Chloroflexia bacterium]
MRTITDWGEAFLSAIGDALSKFFSFLPDLIGALLILWIGWIVAGLLARLVTDVLRRIHFNQAADKAGMSRFIQAAGVKTDASGVLGEIVKWFFRVIALVAAFSVLQLPALTAALIGILNFIPNLAIAVVLILIGGLIANFVADFLRGALREGGFGNSGVIANIARYAILYVAVVAALSQIGVATTIIDTLWIGTIAALALALGLAFGLGGRDVASRMLENAYDKTQQNLPRMSNAIKQKAQQNKRQPDQLPATQTYNNPQTNPGYGYAASPQDYNQPASGNQGYTYPAGGYQAGNNYPQGGTYDNTQGNYPQGGTYGNTQGNYPANGSQGYYDQPRGGDYPTSQG